MKFKRFGNPLLSLAAPLLIFISILGLFQREGRDKVQSLPAFFVGSGLIITGAMRRINRRKMLLSEIRLMKKDDN